MQGRITKGTTIHGVAVNAGEVIECTEDQYRFLAVNGDIEPVNPEVIPEPVHPEPETPVPAKPAKKPAKKKGK